MINIKKAIYIITAIALSVSMLTGCKNDATYVDVDSMDNGPDAQSLNTQVGEYSYYGKSKAYFDGTDCYSFDDKYLYLYDRSIGFNPNNSFDLQVSQMYKIDLQTGSLLSLCDTPACTHDINTYPECINNTYPNYPVRVGNNLWFIKDNCIYEQNAEGENTKIFENEYFTEFDQKYSGVASKSQVCCISHMILDDNYVYLLGISNVIRVDKKTMKADKQIHICDDFLMGQVLYQNKIYVTNMVAEVYEIDFDKEEATKIADQTGSLDIYSEKMYFTRRENGKNCLYTSDMKLDNSKKLIEGCDNYLIKDDKLFYTYNNCVFCYDIKTGENITLIDNCQRIYGITSATYIDRIFVIADIKYEPKEDEDKDALANATISKVVSFRTDGSDKWEKIIDGKNHNE